jgi:hypothetical protein
MKKLVSLTLALMIALLALLPAMAEDVPTVRHGVLSMLNVTEDEMLRYQNARILVGRQLEKEGLGTHVFRQEMSEAGIDESQMDVNIEIVYFDTLDAALMALNAGKIDEISIYGTVAQYLVHSDPNLVQVVTFNEGADENAFGHIARRGLLANNFAFMFMVRAAM